MTSRWLVLAAPLAVVASLVGACTTHGEDGRCDLLNGNNDCASGYVCTAASELFLPDSGGANSQASLCCPQDRTTATPGSICALAPPTPGSDASITDATTDGTVSDATTDQSSGDAGADADAGDGAIVDGAADAPDGD
jgi:hypothetical protein